jgi:5-methyltetrahydropteroyltriglutamate--homocysteine methyltransferase
MPLDAAAPRPRPRFRADHVGSLLRPEALKKARADREAGRLDAEALAEIEDAEIARVVAIQQDIGVPAVTDGEFRRAFWHYDFMGGLTGMRLVSKDAGVAFQGATLKPVHPVIDGLLDFPDDHPMLAHFRYLASVAKATPKISIPGPSCIHFRVAQADVAPEEYRDEDRLFADLAATYRKAVHAFHAAGCRYLQLDDIFFAYLCDPKIRAEKQAAGWDCDRVMRKWAETMNLAIKDRPADMTIGMHMCRGNFKSTWVAQGGYDPAAEAIFSTDVDIYFMEYDSDRAGGFEPLRLLPKGDKRVMPGVITTKTAALEDLDALKRAFDEAGRHADLAQLGIAPQCGFSSTEEGNLITEDDQKRKLDLVVRAAEAIWGAVDA